jgi:hypothetical protein
METIVPVTAGIARIIFRKGQKNRAKPEKKQSFPQLKPLAGYFIMVNRNAEAMTEKGVPP